MAELFPMQGVLLDIGIALVLFLRRAVGGSDPLASVLPQDLGLVEP